MKENIRENLENYLKKPYLRILIPDDESGTFTAEILEFPGCIAQGDTVQEAYELLEEATKAWIEAALDLGQEIPPPSLAQGYGGKVALRPPKSLFGRRSPSLYTKLVMKVVSDVLVTFGVYPQATIDGKGVRTERTQWQEGWNGAFKEISKRIYAVEGQLKGISDELALLLIADVGWLRDGKFILNMNDTFYYCADAEEANEEEVKEIERLFVNHGYKGITYWVANKRGYDPEIPRHKKDVEDVRRIENAKESRGD
jgi:antitoxin HicB